MEDVGSRLEKIEKSVKGQPSVSFKRNSSFRGSLKTNMRFGSNAGLPRNSLAPSPAMSEGELAMDVEAPLEDFNEQETDSEEETPVKVSLVLIKKHIFIMIIFLKIQRDDLVNPYWIEDRDLKNGQRLFLSGHETQFWKDLIGKYLKPLIKVLLYDIHLLN